jgi:indoleamine 2,3-dioxygenase
MVVGTDVAAALESHDVHPERGFLPPVDPLLGLPDRFAPWDHLAAELPKLLMTDQLRRRLDQMPQLSPADLMVSPYSSRMLLERAMMMLSYLGHAYVWSTPPAPVLPASLAVPWHAVAHALGRPPVLSYASYALYNWRRIDHTRDIRIGNIALLQNFWGGADEEWFILIHIDIERQAGPVMAAIVRIHKTLVSEKPAAERIERVTRDLHTVSAGLEGMYATLCRMPEWCDPYIYYRRVRPYIHGWKNNPALPQGLIYEGVAEYGGKPQAFRGETGAQSSIVPALDAILGIKHAAGQLNEYLLEMRTYMPPKHRALLDLLDTSPAVRSLLAGAPSALVDAYNRCVELVEAFRAKHYEYAANYIFKQAQASAPEGANPNPTAIGTGGTPFMPYLKKHLDETGEHKVR